MSEYTPTTQQVEHAYANDAEAEYRDPVNYSALVRANKTEFRRWLAAHDAEVAARALEIAAEDIDLDEGWSERPRTSWAAAAWLRESAEAIHAAARGSVPTVTEAEVVVEVVETEWGVRLETSNFSPVVCFSEVDAHTERAYMLDMFPKATVVCRRKSVPSGPWVSVTYLTALKESKEHGND